MNVYKEIFIELNNSGLKYLIIGGVAVNLYGYSRFTGDIDIILALKPKNLEKLDDLMKKMDYIERLPISIKELGDEKKLQNFIKEKGLKAYTYISRSRPQLDIDIVVEPSLDFDKYAKRANLIQIWDVELPVMSIDDLIGLKKAAGRDKDLIDLEALLHIKEL